MRLHKLTHLHLSRNTIPAMLKIKRTTVVFVLSLRLFFALESKKFAFVKFCSLYRVWS